MYKFTANKNSLRNTSASVLFLFLLCATAYWYGYHEILLMKPQSVHTWRQSDCASLALNYYQHGMIYFHPQVHNLTSDGGTTGYCSTSEAPLLYYTVAILYKIFGYHDFIFRLLNTLIFLSGLFFLFRLLLDLLNDTFWAIALSLFFFTAPVLVYYGNNYLTNSSAFAFSLTGWCYFMRFKITRDYKQFGFSLFLLLVAAAMKVTALFSLFAIAGALIIEMTGITAFSLNEKLFKGPIRYLIPIATVITITTTWLLYARHYNRLHDCTYFSTTIFPIWDLDKDGIRAVWDSVRLTWLPHYFHVSARWFIVLCLLTVLVNFRNVDRLLLCTLLMILVGVFAYVLLQFWTFADHDYYTIDMYILPVVAVLCAFDLLRRHKQKIFRSLVFKILFLVFLGINVHHAKTIMNLRYEGHWNDFKKWQDLYTAEQQLAAMGVNQNDTIIFIPDASHFSLYLLNRKGWTEYKDERFNRGERILYNRSVEGIESSIAKGADYMIVYGMEPFYHKPYLQQFCGNLAGQYRNIFVFKLSKSENHFSLGEREIKMTVSCDAERTTADEMYFIGSNDSILFEYGTRKSSEFARSGVYSIKLDAQLPYGMTIRFPGVEFGESFKVSAWRKCKKQNTGSIVVSASDAKLFYRNEFEIAGKDSSGWERIQAEIFAPFELAGGEMIVYLLNPEAVPVYFDDLHITRYESQRQRLQAKQRDDN